MKRIKIGTVCAAVLLAAGLLFGAWNYGTAAAPSPGKAAAPALSETKMIPAGFSELAAKAKPAVVNIRTVKTIKGGGRVFRHFYGNPFENRSPFRNQDPFRDFFGPFSGGERTPDFKQRSLGSGFIIDKDGYIVTNNHVIDDADQIKVKLSDDREFDAVVVGKDPNTDLALIRIEDSAKLVPLALGDSDTLQIGSWVVAIGSPFGLEQTVTAGIVSAKGRVIGAGPYDDFIQTDASINPGNSGGPLINLKGEVVGINTAIVAQGQGIGFAIPISLAKDVIEQLKKGGKVTRGWLGVGIQDLSAELAEYYGLKEQKGVLVTEVFPGDPAEKAGIKAGDIVLSVEGKDVSGSRDLSRAIAAQPVGKKIPIVVLRDGERKTLSVEISRRLEKGETAAAGEPARRDALGLSVADLTPENAAAAGHASGETGALVISVEPGSRAAKAGVREGDLIKEVNRVKVKNGSGFRDLVVKSGKSGALQMLVKRPGSGLLVIRIDG